MNIEEYLEQVTDLREYKRAQAVKLSEAGLSRGEIAQALSVSEAFVSKWRGRYQQNGTAGLGLAYQGREGFLSESEKEKVLDWLKLCISVMVPSYFGDADPCWRIRECG